MKRKFNFSVNVATDALALPQVSDFLSGIYIDETSEQYFTVLPGVIKEALVPTITFPNPLIGAFDCAPAASDINEDAVKIELDLMSSKPTYCFTDARSQVYNYGLGGKSMFETAQDFNTQLWSEIQKELKQEVEVLRWYGDKTSTSTFLKNTDGVVTQINADLASSTPVSTHITSTTITSANVVAEISKVVKSQLAKGVKRADIVIFMSSSVYQALEDAKLMSIIGTGMLGTSALAQVKFVEVPAFDVADFMIGMPVGNIAYAYNANPSDVSAFDRYPGTFNWFTLIGLNFAHKVLRMNYVTIYK